MRDALPLTETQATPTSEPPEGVLSREWRAYERELQRLIWEGHEGQFALFKGDEFLGVFAKEGLAFMAGVHRFVPLPFLVTPIVWRAPLTRPPDWIVARAQAVNRPPPAPPHPLLRPGLPTMHYTKLTDLPRDHVLFREWCAYRRELPRLLQEGHERQFGLFKGDDLVGIFTTDEEARKVGYEKFSRQPFMITPILEYEPILRAPRIFVRLQPLE